MKLFFKSFFCFIVIFSFSSCLKKKTSPYINYKLSETFRYPILSEPPTLDWNKITDGESALIAQNLMNGLVDYHFSKNGSVDIHPGLARSWTSSPDKKKWIFYLRPSVYWSDGKQLRSQDFIDSWERLLNPKTGAEYAYFLFPIKNAQAYNQGKIKDFKKVGVKIGSSGELHIELNQGLSFLPYLFTWVSTFPIRKDIIEQKGNQWTEPENIVTLGAYQLHRWDHDKGLILKTYQRHYDSSPKQVNKVIFYIVPDETTILKLFSAGRLDVATQLPSRELRVLKKRKEYRNYGILRIYYYGFNIESKNLKDVRVRKALIHAVDRKEIVNLLNGGQTPLKSWIPKGLFGHNPDIGLDFDPKKASQILDKLGYKDRSLFPKIQIFYNTTADHKMIAENIQEQLKRNLSITIELNNQEWKTYLQRLKIKDVEIFRLGWGADYPDPDNFVNLMLSFSDNNHTNWKNDKFDQLVLKAMTTPNSPYRKSLYDQAQKIMLEEDVVVFPIYSAASNILLSDRVQEYPMHVMSHHIPFKTIKFTEDKK